MKKRTRKILLIVIISFVILFSCLLYLSTSMRDDTSRITHPLHVEYVKLFYNTKCMTTDKGYDEQSIIKALDETKIPDEEALKLFLEAKQNLSQGTPMHDMVGVLENCAQETQEYYDFAIIILEH